MLLRSEANCLVAGAGPVGLTLAYLLGKSGVRVTVVEKEASLQKDYRASTFHAATLDLLEPYGISEPLVAMGIQCPVVQYRTWADGVIATLDHALIAGETRHPYRLQCEQFKLSEWLLQALQAMPNVEVRHGEELVGFTMTDEAVTATIGAAPGTRKETFSYLVGADGGRGVTRRILDIAFEGFTYPERILVLGTRTDLPRLIPGLAMVNYVADPEHYAHILRIPDMWRLSLPLTEQVDDVQALDSDYIRSRVEPLIAGFDVRDIAVKKVYAVHQRVAAAYGKGRALLVGDAAHLNNPKGGMGLNGGLHDAVSLFRHLSAHWGDPATVLKQYEAQRRPEAIQAIHKHTQANYNALKGVGVQRAELVERWVALERDKAAQRQFLLDASMLSSLRRCGMLE
ncbi:MAG: FAD-dependent monooxygenase [Pigmentiphaga sp.]|uniref:FAD-dependent oxidoreductase n=1 Tax=Pigmentiphaga sp. TaxID=1977564 RepID=UPI0029B053C0|nr:FAD-dependent monooxygenase [Pigmentiphaga sp.]MDX3907285.1 FAD-dependent monooxygenase [Pigmentiphaga sp.]